MDNNSKVHTSSEYILNTCGEPAYNVLPHDTEYADPPHVVCRDHIICTDRVYDKELRNWQSEINRIQHAWNEQQNAINARQSEINEQLLSSSGGNCGCTKPYTGDADSVNGYKIRVLYPAQYDPNTAEDDTIYFIIKLDENAVNIPYPIVRQYIPANNINLSNGDGWHFVTTPTIVTGEQSVEIQLDAGKSSWTDGTQENKLLTVTILPYIVLTSSSVSLVETGEIIPASSLCTTPYGVTCTYEILSGGSELKDPGEYVVKLSLSDPNCEFVEGKEKLVNVTITESSNPSTGWSFGDSFPIVFGEEGQGDQQND